ncbi:MAG: KUP/HAK/KT family potassium transporter [Candidatus Kapabacteria bacterium]|nr:KUP/HAK/KT family potassium transporter [Candidatus Kapabacteria bacterium]
MGSHGSSAQRATAAGILVTMGIVFGDIGTSPLYTLSAIMNGLVIDETLVLGALSAVFWTLTFQTTLKYVLITLRADNRGEGGIFSLFALVRKLDKRLVIPAVIGGAFLLADGIITPPISVASAVEGLRIYYPHLETVPIVLAIIIGLFTAQQFGTDKVGKLFGPVMVLWFTFIGGIGAMAMTQNPHIIAALNPWYAFHLIVQYPHGFWLLGGVFLCTTGAEALYSDLGHCGRANIRVSWLYVKVCLILSYAGQSAWLLNHMGGTISARPFYAIVPESILPFAIGLATLATIIASQALISGSYTLINEAMQLSLWFKTKVVFPTDIRGQIYVPRINWTLMVGCIVVVLYFEESSRMEAAYGLAITLTMLMTTLLITMYLLKERINKVLAFGLMVVFLTIEVSFLIANSVKFHDGGWFSIAIGVFLSVVMYIIHRSKEIRSRLTEIVPLDVFIPVLEKLSHDESIPKFATHLVYLTASPNANEVEQLAIDSIIRRAPKRADIYWFVNVNTVDEPYKMSYNVQVLDIQTDENGNRDIDVVFVRFNLGFRVEPRLNMMFRTVVEDMVHRGEINIATRYKSLERLNQTGDFRFVLFKRFLSNDNELPANEKLILDAYFQINKLAVSNQEYYGLDTSNVLVENVPLVVSPPPRLHLTREENTIPEVTLPPEH